MKEFFINIWSLAVKGIHETVIHQYILSLIVRGIYEIVIHEYIITNSWGYSWSSYSWIYDHQQLGVFMKHLFMTIWSITDRGIHQIVIHEYMITNS